jgi:hypothetical protein
MSITKNAMVLNLQIGIWQGHRLDKEAGRKVTEEANANADAARVNKHLVPKDALKAITAASTAVRAHFYSKTLPWKDNGDRLLTRLLFCDFIEEHERLTGEFKDTVEEFITEGYPQARARAEFRMGDMFDPNDYPSPDSLRRKFYINMDIDAVTETGDFRVEMDEAHMDTVKASMESAMSSRLNRAMGDVWARVSDVVTSFAERMGTEDAVFRDATVTKIGELIDILPGLNVVEDPDLIRIAADIKAKLTGHTPKELRTQPDLRSQVAGDARDIIDTMAGFMNAFGGQ